ncbi:LOW QUALITY PROTEIN: glutathione S-transferase L3-like [Argentina anserina]|uniref:LOW QUALITY PROTEIN: glutathione S-transferase L3-like n=1 Tax=Argentina anserina TaxID=57926 RepID=UPI00217646F9|nr:LOW QUALITY PROTEIN: glutathione S-transferase L3-like [Potentilla anserina]
MITLKVSFRGTVLPSSSPQTSWHHSSDSVSFSLPKKSLTANFPNTTILCHQNLRVQASFGEKTRPSVSAIVATGLQEVLPPALTSSSVPPTLFDGKTRLYVSYTCSFAQRAWIVRNLKELEKKIKLVPLDLLDRPSWYKEKVNSTNKVPSLEHNNKIILESLDLIKYINSNFEGPSLFPDDPAKREFAEDLFSYTDFFNTSVFSFFKGDGTEADAGATFDYIETALTKFEDGPFFLGRFSRVDIAYAPFVERFQPFALDVKKLDITAGRPKLAAWIEEMDQNDAYNRTRRDPKVHVEIYKCRFPVTFLYCNLGSQIQRCCQFSNYFMVVQAQVCKSMEKFASNRFCFMHDEPNHESH